MSLIPNIKNELSKSELVAVLKTYYKYDKKIDLFFKVMASDINQY